ncbi:MAG: hypothetical protein IPO06_18845 [Leptospiraceae bacterium]|nr:hypothetical protein [Leptospiraceae bacterium]
MEKKQAFQEYKLKLQVEEFLTIIRITWTGECTSRNPSDFLNPLMDKYYKIAQSTQKKLVFDFLKTEYMNSAAIMPVIRIMKLIKEGDSSIQVIYDEGVRWQSVLIGELKIFETNDKRVQVIGETVSSK